MDALEFKYADTLKAELSLEVIHSDALLMKWTVKALLQVFMSHDAYIKGSKVLERMLATLEIENFDEWSVDLVHDQAKATLLYTKAMLQKSMVVATVP